MCTLSKLSFTLSRLTSTVGLGKEESRLKIIGKAEQRGLGSEPVYMSMFIKWEEEEGLTKGTREL